MIFHVSSVLDLQFVSSRYKDCQSIYQQASSIRCPFPLTHDHTYEWTLSRTCPPLMVMHVFLLSLIDFPNHVVCCFLQGFPLATCLWILWDSWGHSIRSGSLVYVKSMESFLHPPRCDCESLILIPSPVEWADKEKYPGIWTFPMNLLPWLPELLEPVPRLDKVRLELPSLACHWTSLPFQCVPA